MNILIACDKFRGSLEGDQVVEQLTIGLLEKLPDAKIETTVLADGGEGSMEIIGTARGAKRIRIQIRDAIGHERETSFFYHEEEETAILEMAAYVGLATLSSEDRNPSRTSSFGLGEAMKKAINLGARKIILGIGGSATNDGGAGVLEALGFQFQNEKGVSFSPVGGNLKKITEIIRPEEDEFGDVEITIASDVDNLICGQKGASFTYGLQKGAKENELPELDDNLRHYAELVAGVTGSEVFEKSGYGAAGGVALSLCEFFGASLKSGSELIFELLNLEERIKWADVIITGEGKIDHQTAHGKAIAPIIHSALDKSIYLVCGIFEEIGDSVLDNLDRFELAKLADELKLDSFSDAKVLAVEAGRRIAQDIKRKSNRG